MRRILTTVAVIIAAVVAVGLARALGREFGRYAASAGRGSASVTGNLAPEPSVSGRELVRDSSTSIQDSCARHWQLQGLILGMPIQALLDDTARHWRPTFDSMATYKSDWTGRHPAALKIVGDRSDSSTARLVAFQVSVVNEHELDERQGILPRGSSPTDLDSLLNRLEQAWGLGKHPLGGDPLDRYWQDSVCHVTARTYLTWEGGIYSGMALTVRVQAVPRTTPDEAGGVLGLPSHADTGSAH